MINFTNQSTLHHTKILISSKIQNVETSFEYIKTRHGPFQKYIIDHGYSYISNFDAILMRESELRDSVSLKYNMAIKDDTKPYY